MLYLVCLFLVFVLFGINYLFVLGLTLCSFYHVSIRLLSFLLSQRVRRDKNDVDTEREVISEKEVGGKDMRGWK